MRFFLSTLLATVLLGTVATAEVRQAQQADLRLERDYTNQHKAANLEHGELESSHHLIADENQRHDQKIPSIATDVSAVDVAAADGTPPPVAKGGNVEPDLPASKVHSCPKHSSKKSNNHHKNSASRYPRRSRHALELQRKRANRHKKKLQKADIAPQTDQPSLNLWHSKKADIAPETDQPFSNKKGDNSHDQSTSSREEPRSGLTSTFKVEDGTFTAQDSQPCDATGGDNCIQFGGYNSVLTAGYNSTQTALGNSTLTARWGSNQTAGQESWIVAGYRSEQTAGVESSLTAGYGSTQAAGEQSTLIAGYGTTSTAGIESALIAGYGSTQTAGYRSNLTAGYGSTQTAQDNSTLFAGYGSTETAGHQSSLITG
ncbi:hypothetical protein EC968_008661, partial [Mortierella alpina]